MESKLVTILFLLFSLVSCQDQLKDVVSTNTSKANSNLSQEDSKKENTRKKRKKSKKTDKDDSNDDEQDRSNSPGNSSPGKKAPVPNKEKKEDGETAGPSTGCLAPIHIERKLDGSRANGEVICADDPELKLLVVTTRKTCGGCRQFADVVKTCKSEFDDAGIRTIGIVTNDSDLSAYSGVYETVSRMSGKSQKAVSLYPTNGRIPAVYVDSQRIQKIQPTRDCSAIINMF